MKVKKLKLVALGLVLLVSYNCKEAKKEVKENMGEVTKKKVVESVKFTMEPKSDSAVNGEVLFTEKDGKVMMVARLSGLSEGEHAIHIHEKADCSSADGKSTGGHWNPTHEPHGKWGAAEGYHKGDIGNFVANAAGYATVEFDTDQWCLTCEDPNKNIIGKAVIVHQGVDDFTSQPSGAAGARISCTGIIQ